MVHSQEDSEGHLGVGTMPGGKEHGVTLWTLTMLPAPERKGELRDGGNFPDGVRAKEEQDSS